MKTVILSAIDLEVEGNRLLEILRSPMIGEAEVNEAIRIISSTSAAKHAYEASKDFVMRAKARLNALPSSEAKNALLSLADFISKRSF